MLLGSLPRGLLLVVSCAAAANHYETLGVPHDATLATIKAAYRKQALRHHPDKQQHSAGVAVRSASKAQMERLNDAYATLADPEERRRYDHARTNPFARQQYEQYNHHPQHRYEPVVIKVTVPCTLEQLGGYAPVTVMPDEAFVGGRRSQQLEPIKVFLPPGSRSGEKHRFSLPRYGATLVLQTTFETPHARFTRHGDDLEATVWLPAWHNRAWWRGLNRWRPIRVRAICGHSVRVCSASVFVHGGGSVRTISGYGLPVHRRASSGASPYSCARGDLRVHLKLRTPKQSATRCLGALGAAIGCAGVMRRVAPWRRLTRLLFGPSGPGKRVLSVWTGPGPGIGEPFRIWGQGSRYFAYKTVYS